MDLSICIVNWNTKDFLRRCLRSIYQETTGIDFEIIVADNASQDGSTEMVGEEFPHCKVVRNTKNLGFSKANNLAIAQASGRYIAFLNPDTEVKTRALVGMTRFLEANPQYGAVGCKVLDRNGAVQPACARDFPTPLGQLRYLLLVDHLSGWLGAFAGADAGYLDARRDVDCLSGACMVARSEIIDRLGGFNEGYFMYGEDIDLCYRIRKEGWLIHYLADREIYHLGGASSSQRGSVSSIAVTMHESDYKFLKDNYGKSKADQFRTCVLVGSALRMALLGLLLPALSICRISQRQVSVHSFRKYVSLFWWAARVRPLRGGFG